MYSVRLATLDDMDFLIPQMEISDAMYPAHHSLLPDPEEINLKVSSFIQNHVALIGLYKEKPVGYIFGYLSQHLFNSKLSILSELFWWVIPEHRASRVGAMLLDSFTKAGLEHGCHWIMLNINKDTQIKPSSFEKKGFKRSDTTYLKEIM